MNNNTKNRPHWLVQRIPADRQFGMVSDLMTDLKLNTVCQSADCPNIGECFSHGTATFMILGGVCTRNCRFCSVPKGTPHELDFAEPGRVSDAIKALKLKHAVITSVTRDDLIDGGAGQFAACINLIRKENPLTSIEVLVPDFAGDVSALRTVLEAEPDVFNHNIETIKRLYPSIRPEADYDGSLKLLHLASARASLVKSGFMVGLGETDDEVMELLNHLYVSGVRAVTIGQYLQPSRHHAPLEEYIHPDKFRWYEQAAYSLGFVHVAAGTFVRSSYHAADFAARNNQASPFS